MVSRLIQPAVRLINHWRAGGEGIANLMAGNAGEGIRRLMARFIGGGYVAYLVVVGAEIATDSAIVAPWWTPLAVMAAFGPGIALLASSFTSVRRWTATILPLACGAGYLISVATWFLAWNGVRVAGERATWLVAFPGLAALALVLTRWPWLALAHLICAVPLVQLANASARAGHYRDALAADVVWGVAFSSLFAVAGVMAVKTGDVLDSTRERNQRLAGQAAAQRSREAERTFYDRLAHDKVLTLLRDARQSGENPRMTGLARSLLRELTDPSVDTSSTHPMGFDYVANLARNAIVESGAASTLHLHPPRDSAAVRVPLRAALALGDATGEALRNAHSHAGDGAAITVTVTDDAARLTITIADRGRGFDPRSVGDTSLGLAMSIVGRMEDVRGVAQIHSAPGSGTKICLWWPA